MLLPTRPSECYSPRPPPPRPSPRQAAPPPRATRRLPQVSQLPSASSPATLIRHSSPQAAPRRRAAPPAVRRAQIRGGARGHPLRALATPPMPPPEASPCVMSVRWRLLLQVRCVRERRVCGWAMVHPPDRWTCVPRAGRFQSRASWVSSGHYPRPWLCVRLVLAVPGLRANNFLVCHDRLVLRSRARRTRAAAAARRTPADGARTLPWPRAARPARQRTAQCPFLQAPTPPFTPGPRRAVPGAHSSPATPGCMAPTHSQTQVWVRAGCGP
jgi:hypothetical protein